MSDEHGRRVPHEYRPLVLAGVMGLALAGAATRFIDPLWIFGGTDCSTTGPIYSCVGYPPMLIIPILAVSIVVSYRIYTSGAICAVFGHTWSLSPPWSGKELRHNPQCERCGHEPENVAITGSHQGDHRV